MSATFEAIKANLETLRTDVSAAAEAVHAANSRARLSEMQANVGRLESESGPAIVEAVKVALAYLIVEGSPQVMNDLLGVMREGNRALVEKLVQKVTVYQVKAVDKDSTTYRAVGGKKKAKGDKKIEMESGAFTNYLRFMNEHEGDVFKWAKAADKEWNDQQKAIRQAVRDEKAKKKLEETPVYERIQQSQDKLDDWMESNIDAELLSDVERNAILNIVRQAKDRAMSAYLASRNQAQPTVQTVSETAEEIAD